MKIEWDKIITNAISALVVAVFLGAATIVWKGATSVDNKVQSTREDMQHLITAISDQLAEHRVQLNNLSNQLATFIAEADKSTITTSNNTTLLSKVLEMDSTPPTISFSVPVTRPVLPTPLPKLEPPLVAAAPPQTNVAAPAPVMSASPEQQNMAEQSIRRKAYSQDIERQLKR